MLKDTPESYNPQNLKQIGLMVLELQPIVFSLKDRVKQQALSLYRSKLVSLSEIWLLLIKGPSNGMNK